MTSVLFSLGDLVDGAIINWVKEQICEYVNVWFSEAKLTYSSLQILLNDIIICISIKSDIFFCLFFNLKINYASTCDLIYIYGCQFLLFLYRYKTVILKPFDPRGTFGNVWRH